MAQPIPMPVWTDSSGATRLAFCDLGPMFHRGQGAARPVKLWNSLSQENWPTMTDLRLRAVALDPFTQGLLDHDALQVWMGAWISLTEPIDLGELACGASIDLWLRVVLPDEVTAGITLGRIRAELEVSWG